MDDLRFNRIRKNGRHKYLDDFDGLRRFEDHQYHGFIKCKLVHNEFYSIVLPDQIYVEFVGETRWVQPLYFIANQILKTDAFGICDIGIDISHGVCLRVRFRSDGLVSKLSDGSLFYRCEIKGPKFLYQYTTGAARVVGNRPIIKLYHHTSRASKQGIQEANEFWTSNWNCNPPIFKAA